MNTGEIMMSRRNLLDISRKDLGSRVGVSERSIAKYELDGVMPAFDVALRIAEELRISPSRLGGKSVAHLDVSGDWFLAFVAYYNGEERVEEEQVTITQDGLFCEWTGQADPQYDEGSFGWTGEAELKNNQHLAGTYAAATGKRNCGTMFLNLEPHDAQYALGHWNGHSHDGAVEHGWCALARTRVKAFMHLTRIKGYVGVLPPSVFDES